MKLTHVALLPLLAALPASAQVAEDAAGPLTLSQHTFADPGMGGMASHTILVPKGWKAEGGAFWANQRYFNVLPSQDIRVTSPEGVSVRVEPALLAKDIIPSGQFGVRRPAPLSAEKGFPVLYLPQNLGQWKRWFQTELIGASVERAERIRVRNVAVVPELTYALEQVFAPTRRMIEQQNAMGAASGMHSSTECYVLGIESTYRVGKRSFEELRLVAITAMHNDSNMLGRDTLWSVERAVTFTAPKGDLEASLPMLKAIGDSLRMTPKWLSMRIDLEARLMKIQREVAADNMRHAQERSRIIAQTGREISDIISKGYAERTAIQDRTHAKVVNTILGVEDYVTPGQSNYVQLPTGYDNVYANGAGDYILSNDALFDPNVDAAASGGSWSRMTMRR